MKKLLLIGLSGLVLAACGAAETGGNETESLSMPESSSKVASSEAVSSEAASSEKAAAEGVYFENDTLKIDMATVKLTQAEVLPPNEYNEFSQLVITYDFTNDSDEPLQPGTVFIACFNATQETEATIEDLDVGMSPQGDEYAALNEMSFTDVKPGATVQSVIAYDIKYDGQPITLTATQGIAGDELGTKIYEF